MTQISNNILTRLSSFYKKYMSEIIYISILVVTSILTLLEVKKISLVFLQILFIAIMIFAKIITKKKSSRRILSLFAFSLYACIAHMYGLDYSFDLSINKWSFLTAAFIILDEGYLISILVGFYPAARLLMMLFHPNPSIINVGKIIGVANGQISFTITAVITYHLFRKLLGQRNLYLNLSNTDPLTGLANLSHTIDSAKKMLREGNISLLLTDMDRFKQINDTYGHMAGNKVLIDVSQFILKETEGLDRIVGRLGGDEFIIVVKNDGSKKILDLGEKLMNSLKNKYFSIDPDIDPITLSFSVGQANSTDADIDIEKLMHKADVNMFYNKYKNHRSNMLVDKHKPSLSKEGSELLNVLAEKDMYTYIHSAYTAQYAAALGKELGFSNDKVEILFTAGWLHDVGKVLISNDIIRKSSSLTDDEYGLIKKHVSYGINILHDLSLPEEVMTCIKYHHEHWDGSGYPKKLSQKNIPPEARVLQIADSYSAMIIKRVYRNVLTPEEALEEIKKNSGKQFDPEYVNAFESLVRGISKAV
ncbi:bifunctional diguanylate cyclase/phosphohydrolase [Pseudobacteroides cellulosolvens]|uniref:Diguanylate cyclase and metal dependent phosphohydrolase n=2 Tax=Pseudobacteroides cellulosolvens TaxID=35825 RepID=A0A0L6JVX8_9FIRM|nr:diguanylate cyclase [Pseudobacteroides cellulosolvens]KNY29592.1 diguanylate cyclase and metal dependent phosphohydrolase [Pseudobacteroides cellulosolvens ATCC 35603 = DSM 2933]